MSTPDVPEPDAKNWTWVIEQRCPDCGFDGPSVVRADVPDLTRRFAAVLIDALREPGAAMRSEPATWSRLEYAAHVRDVCEVFAGRLSLMLTEDDPQFANWDQDETALTERYWEQDPAAVASELAAGAKAIANAFGRVADEQWTRPGRRSDGSVFTVDTFARYFLHDLAHHAWDITGTRW